MERGQGEQPSLHTCRRNTNLRVGDGYLPDRCGGRPPASRRMAWRATSVRRGSAAARFRPPYVPDITARSALDRVRRSLRSSGPLNEASISRVQVGRGRFVLRAAGGPVDLEDHPAGAPAAELMDSMLILLVQYLEEIIVEKLEDDVRFPRRVAQLVQGLLGAWRWP